jgi:hypothetical protein
MKPFGVIATALGFACFSFAYGKLNQSEAKAGEMIAEHAGELRKQKNEAFKKGEVLKFRLHYGFMDAGEAVLEVKNEDREIGGRKVFHMVGVGYSKGSFDWFYKVRDRYETYVDQEALLPWIFIRRVNEGGYVINQDYIFNHYKDKVDVGEGKVFDTPDNVQDMLSAFYFTRSLDFSNAKAGDIYTIPAFVDKEVFPMKIKYIGKETIKTDLGKIRCIKFRPVVQKGRIFKKEEDLNVWITDDKNHIPVRAQAEILVGSIKMDLIDYSGLANPISKVN